MDVDHLFMAENSPSLLEKIFLHLDYKLPQNFFKLTLIINSLPYDQPIIIVMIP